MKPERVQAFSDGVFAILITILVLELKLPNYEVGKLSQAVLKQWPILFSYIVSYTYIGILWLFHHDLFSTLKKTTIRLNVINLVSLFLITLLSYSTILLASSISSQNQDDMRFSLCIYDGLAFLISFSYFRMYLYLSKHESLLKEFSVDHYTKKAIKYPIISMSIYLLAFLFTFVNVYLGALLLICGIIFHGYAYYKIAQSHVRKMAMAEKQENTSI